LYMPYIMRLSIVSVSGDSLAVSAWGEDSNQTTISNGTTASNDNSASASGAVYVYHRESVGDMNQDSTPERLGAHQQAYLKASNAEAGDFFGVYVAIDGDTVAGGANGEDSNQTTITNGTTASADNSVSNSGAVYDDKRNGTAWSQEAYIKAGNPDINDYFANVVISGDTLAVGAGEEDSDQTTITNGTTASTSNLGFTNGAVYVYKKSSASWAQEAYIKAANSGATDFFGIGLALNGDTLVVGVNWEDSNVSGITNGATASSDNSSTQSGAVYIYRRTGVTWAQEAFIKHPNNRSYEFFGSSGTMAIDGETLVIGASGDDSNQTTITNGTGFSSDTSVTNSGAVLVYKRTGSTWVQQAYIKAANSETNDGFGWPVSIYADTLAVGSWNEDSNQTTITNGTGTSSDNSSSNSGAVYVFKRTGNNWAQEAYIKASNANIDDSLSSLSLNRDTLAVGAQYEDSNQTTITNGTGASSDNSLADSGAVYVYRRTGATWAQEAYIKASNAGTNDYFGFSVSVDGDLLAVSAPSEDSASSLTVTGATAPTDDNSSYSGAVYIYRRTGTTWSQVNYIKASNNRNNSVFGSGVSLFSDTLAVGSNGESSNQQGITNGSISSSNTSSGTSGAVYVYRLQSL
jgi:hypothetical protein